MSSPLPERTNLLGLPRPALEAFVAQLGSRPFRARQLMNWIYKRGVGEPGTMTDLAKSIEQNVVHGSDAPDTAAREIAYFFSATELHPRS